MSDTISTAVARRRLARLWFTAGPAIFVLLVLQSMFGKYGDRVEDAWAWFLPTVMPTLALIVSVFVIGARDPERGAKKVDRVLFQIAYGLSALYLFLVILTPLVQPFVGQSPLELMSRSNLWLGPLQGLVAAALGAFFVKGEQG